MQENISSIITKTMSLTKTGFETNTEIIQVETKMENVFKLRTPVVYKLEDLVMSLTILLILLFMLIIWYGVARFIIFLAYRKTNKRMEYLDDIQEDLFSV